MKKEDLIEIGKLLKMVEKSVFSPRPYKLGQCCDGSIDACVFALFFDYCEKNNLDWKELYKKAYPETDTEEINEDFLKQLAEWEGVEYPQVWDKKAIEGLLKSLGEINNHSLVDVLSENLPY